MLATHDRSRRDWIAGLAGISLSAAVAHASGSELPRRAKSPTLVAYFSRSGNTRVVAGLIQRAFDADLFEIKPATPYPEEYLATVKQATEERDRGVEPSLFARVSDLARYETIYLGFPIWGQTAPSVIRSFLRAHDLSDKRLVPFITHGGYGLGQSQAVLASHAPKARLQSPFPMQADQERQTMNTVNTWLKESREVKS
jgi:flavodoxin